MTECLVIGGSGFIGSALALELAKRGDKVDIMDVRRPDLPELKDFPYIFGDIRYVEYFDCLPEYDEVYNLAGALGTSELIGKEDYAIDVNIKGQLNVLEYCRKKNAVLFYPEKPAPRGWMNTYTITKSCATEFTKMYGKVYGVDVRLICWYNAVGPRERLGLYRKAVPYFITQALQGRELQVYGSGEQTMDCIYVDDLVKITVDFVRRCPRPDLDVVYELGCHCVRVKDLAKKIMEIVGKGRIVYVPMRLGEPENSFIKADNRRLLEYLGYDDVVFTGFEEMLRKTIKWYEENPDKWWW